MEGCRGQDYINDEKLKQGQKPVEKSQIEAPSSRYRTTLISLIKNIQVLAPSLFTLI